jgi:hypothetical protein
MDPGVILEFFGTNFNVTPFSLFNGDRYQLDEDLLEPAGVSSNLFGQAGQVIVVIEPNLLILSKLFEDAD